MCLNPTLRGIAGARLRLDIGRPRIEPAFDFDVIDSVIPVADAASVAAMRHLREITGRAAGPSTGACLFGALHLVGRMREQGRAATGSWDLLQRRTLRGPREPEG